MRYSFLLFCRGYADHQRVTIPLVQSATGKIFYRSAILPTKKHCLELKRAKPIKKKFKEIPVVDDDIVHVPHDISTEEEWSSLDFVQKVGSPIHQDYYRRSSVSSSRRKSAPLINYTGYLRQKTLPTTYYNPRAKFTSRIDFGRSVTSEIYNPRQSSETRESGALGSCDIFNVINCKPAEERIENPNYSSENIDRISLAQLCTRSRRASKALIRKARNQQMDLNGFSTGLMTLSVPYEKVDLYNYNKVTDDAFMELHDTLRPEAGRRFRSRRRSSMAKERFLSM